MKAYINGHEFERISERFNFGDGASIEMPPCYVIDGETVAEQIYYEALRSEVSKADHKRQPLLVDLDRPEASGLELDARELWY